MDTLLKINDQLMNAPAGVLVALFAIALGYILKGADFFPNSRIPLVVVLVCAVVFPALLYSSDHQGSNVLRNIIVGFIIGFVAWTLHARILSRWLDPKLFPSQSNDPPTPPPCSQ